MTVVLAFALLIAGVYLLSSTTQARQNAQFQVLPNFADSRYKEIYLAGGAFGESKLILTGCWAWSTLT
ncbi:MAG: hypothetical protein ACOX57_05610 [Limnochordia bacterium]